MYTLMGLIGTLLAGIGAEIFSWGLEAETFEMLHFGGIAAAFIGIVMAIFGFKTLLMTQREKTG
jgi:predicted lysophospholipase L1 biosynthesis ABC-type transport system permease subunit